MSCPARPLLVALAALSLLAGACSGSGADAEDAAVTPDRVAPRVPATSTTASTAAASGVTATSVCANPTVTVTGTITDPALDEISGIVASRRTEDVLWVHEDGGNPPAFVAIGRDGRVRGSVRIDGGDIDDAEDIAIGPGPVAGTPYLYLADIGDNAVARTSVMVLRMAEPDPTAVAVTPDRIEVRYPDGAHNAEAFVVHPITGDWFVITKESGDRSHIYRAAAPTAADRRVTLADVGAFDVRPDLVTGADLSRDGTVLVVRTYVALRIFTVRDGEVGAAAPLCFFAYLEEAQGEAVAFAADGRLVTVSEGANPEIHLVG